ncbi:MAG: hypothetical protein KGI84_08750, partial [Elusimicrobia bacterium]|nr:hypothetical protein [Elusimicrobiota bacterium]
MSKKLLAFFSIAAYFLLSNACTIGAAASAYAPCRASAAESASKPSHSRRDHDSDHCCGDL